MGFRTAVNVSADMNPDCTKGKMRSVETKQTIAELKNTRVKKPQNTGLQAASQRIRFTETLPETRR